MTEQLSSRAVFSRRTVLKTLGLAAAAVGLRGLGGCVPGGAESLRC